MGVGRKSGSVRSDSDDDGLEVNFTCVAATQVAAPSSKVGHVCHAYVHSHNLHIHRANIMETYAVQNYHYDSDPTCPEFHRPSRSSARRYQVYPMKVRLLRRPSIVNRPCYLEQRRPQTAQRFVQPQVIACTHSASQRDAVVRIPLHHSVRHRARLTTLGVLPQTCNESLEFVIRCTLVLQSESDILSTLIKAAGGMEGRRARKM